VFQEYNTSLHGLKLNNTKMFALVFFVLCVLTGGTSVPEGIRNIISCRTKFCPFCSSI